MEETQPANGMLLNALHTEKIQQIMFGNIYFSFGRQFA